MTPDLQWNSGLLISLVPEHGEALGNIKFFSHNATVASAAPAKNLIHVSFDGSLVVLHEDRA